MIKTVLLKQAIRSSPPSLQIVDAHLSCPGRYHVHGVFVVFKRLDRGVLGGPHSEVPMKTLPRQERRHCSVIVVEDSHTDARLILQALLQDDHHLQVTVLTDGDRATSHVHEPNWDAPPFHQPDLVLLDLSLPGKDGLEVLSDLKNTPQLSGVPIVVFTGTERPDEVKQCYDLGANCVAFKPMETRPFMDTVQSIGRYWLDVVGPRAHARARAEAWRGKLPPELDEIP